MTQLHQLLQAAAAVAGIDIESPQFLEAIQTTIDAIGNNYG